VNKDDYIRYFVNNPVPSVNYCDGLGRCFRFVCIYACAAVFLCVATVFTVNKDLYVIARAALSIWWALRTSPCRGPNPSVDRRVRWMRRAPGWQGALRTSVSCLPVNAALIIAERQTDRHADRNTPSAYRGGRSNQFVWHRLNGGDLTAERRRRRLRMNGDLARRTTSRLADV